MALDAAFVTRFGERLGAPRNATKADVFLLREGGEAVVVKTIAGRPTGVRRLLAGYLLRREGRMLARLRGTPGVPALLESSTTAIVVEWRPGKTLFQLRKKGVSAETARRIEETLAGMHARGFAHGDIGRRDVFVADDGAVSLVDFATAVGPGCPPVLWRLLLPFLRRRDRGRVAKLIRRYRRRWDERVARRSGSARGAAPG